MIPPAPRGRREFLRAGGLGLLGFSLPRLLQGRAIARAAFDVGNPGSASPSFGRAKSCILLFMWGGPAQQETWDLKPEAPEQVRGEFRPIETNVPGILISEHFPQLARRVDKLAIIRSMHHADVNHTTATHEILTGRSVPPNASRLEDDWPHYGAVLASLGRGGDRVGMPPYVQMRPAITENGAPRFVESSHGQTAGWLGPALNPFTIDHAPDRPDYHVGEFRLPENVAAPRFESRTRLLDLVDAQSRAMSTALDGPAPGVDAMQTHYLNAYRMLRDERALRAFDLSREDPRLRERYGMNPHGQAVLQARRLVEAGVPLVTVFWQNDGLTNVSVYWDTHNRNFIDLKTRLMPPADQAFSALLDDLEARGMLDETLVVWTGEFGRTPRVGQGVVGGAGAGRDGRDHWPHCFSSVLAGAGVRGGVVHGASDKWAARPARDPVTPADLAATIYHLLGVPHDLELKDPLDRPLRLTLGEPVPQLLA